MNPKDEREWLLWRAREVRGWLDEVIEYLEEPKDTDHARVVAHWGKVVREVHEVAFGNEKMWRWRVFVEALERCTARWPDRSDLWVADRVMRRYREVFPDRGHLLQASQVEAAVHAWRTDLQHWQGVRAALSAAVPSLPSARSLATKWSALTRTRPSRAPSRKRPSRTGRDAARPRGVKRGNR